MTEKYLYSLNRIISREIDNENDFQNLKSEALNVMIKIYGENSHFEKDLKKIQIIRTRSISLDGGNGLYKSPGSDNLKSCIVRCKNLIKIIIEDIETYGTPEKSIPEKSKSTNEEGQKINLNVVQTNNNTQKVSLKVILNQLEEELSPDQIKELQNILDSNSTDKKQQILNSLKSFGSDVCANIIAGILTIPSIFS